MTIAYDHNPSPNPNSALILAKTVTANLFAGWWPSTHCEKKRRVRLRRVGPRVRRQSKANRAKVSP